jgi:hypothetical protein
MNLESISREWKCIGIIVATAVALCGTAVGFDQRYAKSADLRQLQISANYNNFQMRLDSLRAAYLGKPIPPEVQQQINWLEKQIKLLEAQMETTN